MNCGVLVFEFKEIISCGPNQINFLKLEKKKKEGDKIQCNAQRVSSQLLLFISSIIARNI